MMRKSQIWLLVAIGLGVASVAIVLSSHFLWLRPVWSFAPPLPGTPVGLVALGPPASDLDRYQGCLLSAVLTGGLAFNAWLAGVALRRRERSAPPFSRWLLVLPVLLLVPSVVHFVGAVRYNRASIRVNNEWLKQYRLRKAPPRPAAGGNGAAGGATAAN